ncbi:Elongation of very long chain fatty acids protein 7 [Camelus dromedarius]|uniref:Elongation of very long chain fatty acids protein n=1 Tax=Camelus dromedarius TaxID=9838 RepID=A0A5N4EC76_CAMDR|nr:Elongation of very long chain fatty acids protein 7 [Camelus dromedarius]
MESIEEIFALDPRVEDWLFMSSPLPHTVILGLYVYFVTSLGPKLMENRKPFELKKVMITYNFLIVLFSVYMCYEASVFSIPHGRILPESLCLTVMMFLVMTARFVMSGWGTGYSLRCEIVDYSRSPTALRNCYKEESGLGTFHAFLNTAVHVVMYSYYGLCALGPAYQKYLWWKKYLTSLQLVQFVIITIHIGQFFFMEDCNYQFPVFLYVIMSYGCIFLLLFLHFWYRAYTKGQRLPKTVKNGICKNKDH